MSWSNREGIYWRNIFLPFLPSFLPLWSITILFSFYCFSLFSLFPVDAWGWLWVSAVVSPHPHCLPLPLGHYPPSHCWERALHGTRLTALTCAWPFPHPTPVPCYSPCQTKRKNTGTVRITQNNVHSFQHKLWLSGLPPCRASNNFCWAIQAQGKATHCERTKAALAQACTRQSGEAGDSTSGQAWSLESRQVGCPEHDKAREGPNKPQSMRNRSALKIIMNEKAQSLASETVWQTTRPNDIFRRKNLWSEFGIL